MAKRDEMRRQPRLTKVDRNTGPSRDIAGTKGILILNEQTSAKRLSASVGTGRIPASALTLHPPICDNPTTT